jgi:hypothetical protein
VALVGRGGLSGGRGGDGIGPLARQGGCPGSGIYSGNQPARGGTLRSNRKHWRIGDFARRADAGLHRVNDERRHTAVSPANRCPGSAAGSREPGSRQPLLVAGQQVGGVWGRREAEAGGSGGRRSRGLMRCELSQRRQLE